MSLRFLIAATREGRIMKPASSPGRLLSVAICTLLSAAAAQAADEAEANATQLAQQVLQTGAEDTAAASEATDLAQSTSESDVGLLRITLPDGTSMMNLEGRFQSVLVATPTEDGGQTVSCHTGKDAVDHAQHARDVIAGVAAKDQAPAQAASPETPAAPQALEEK